MDRRQMLTTIGMGAAGMAIGTGFTAPACGVSKEKAVRVTEFVIELTKEATPLLDLLGAHDIATLVTTKAIPALEKLKEFLSKADIPQASSTLETVRNVLKGIGNALLNLPQSPTRTKILAVLLSINGLLLTVEAFVRADTGAIVTTESALTSSGSLDTKILKAYEATAP